MSGICTPSAAETVSGSESFSLAPGGALLDNDGKALSIKNPVDVSINIGTGAVLSSSDDGIHGGDATGGTVSITNSGTIESTAGGQAIDLNDFVGPDNTSTITNNAGGLIKADDADGIRPGANATVVNAGTIYADGATGDSHDGIDFQEAPTGTVINESGGLISGKRHGITTDGYVDVYNAAGATIIGRNGSGVGSDGTGKVVNYGTIIGGYDGSGTGDGDGVDIDGYATVTNYGTIEAQGAAGFGKDGGANVSEGLALTGGGVVINEKNALITSAQVGATLCCTATPFLAYNYGTINGTDVGISVGSSANAGANITLYNYGMITSADRAFVANTYPGLTIPTNITIYNSGTISGKNYGLFLAPDTNSNVYMYAGSTITGAISNNGSLTLHNDTDYTMSNDLIGNGILTKAGSGLLDYTGDGSAYDGQAYVSSGTLAVDGNLAATPVTVESGAMLMGGGSVGSVVVDQGASLEGGRDGTGTLSVNGNLQQQAGSTLLANGGLVSVTGHATIAQGAQLSMTQNAVNDLRTSAQYQVLSAAQGVSGTYTLLGDTQLSAFESVTDAYDANDVYLRTEQTRAFTDVAVTRNQIATAGALDALDGAGMGHTVGLVNSDAQARQAFNATSGEIHASARTELVQDSFYLRNAAIDRLRGAACDPGAGPQSTATLRGRRTDGTCQQQRAAMWGEAYGGWGHNSGDGNAAGMHHSVGGFILGADAPVFGTWRVGGLVSYGHSAFDVGARDSSGHSNTVSVGGYAGTHWGRLALRIGATYSWDMLGMNRQVAFSGYSGRESSAYMGGTAQGFGDLGYRLDAGPVALEPFANVAYVNLHTDGFHEHGGSAALAGRAIDTGTTYSTFGVRMASHVRAGAITLVPNASFAYRHAFGELTPTTREYFARGGGATFDIAGVPLSENAAVLDAGLKAVMSNRIDVGVSYIGQYGERSIDSGIRGKFRLKF
ncbi:autotransporter outer membrane beta-barrel domain-containing protein [Novacetimonas pomaceti]|uniref:autotransporter outer membrane beta-barrel domain-containing protein n=1 Tax=Novacetimonas pomaceti TaxID=2021998 RepID=UPI001EF0E8EF|nr:autotransporter domain-containing protein [Novacetimonas pomaceti]